MSTPQEEHKEIEQKIIEIKDRYPERCNIEGLEPAFSHDLREAIAFGQSLKDDGENSQVFTVQEDNWKERLEQWKEHFYWYVGLGEGYKYSKKEMIDEIDSILSSQAHALKEQMKACVPKDKRKNLIYGRDTSYDIENANGFNDCREQTLYAIESIEI